MKMMLGTFCLAFLRYANISRWEPEGYYAMSLGDHDYRRLPAANLDKAKAILMASLPEPCRSLVRWEGEL